MKTNNTKTTKTTNIENMKTSVKEDFDFYLKAFGQAWGAAEENIQKAADAFYQACCLAGFEETRAAFSTRYPSLSNKDWQLLHDIGGQTVDCRVFMLPTYMHGIAKMPLPSQWDILNTKRIGVYKFSTEKPTVIDLGKINESDWRVAFDREKCVLRSSKEQLDYIHAKKKEFKTAIRWKLGSKPGTVVFMNSCTLTKAKLQEILDLL